VPLTEETGLRLAALAISQISTSSLPERTARRRSGPGTKRLIHSGRPELRRALADWATNAEIDEATTAPQRRPPYDALHHRVRSYLEPHFGAAGFRESILIAGP
jgi:hypothetical protein